MINIVIVLGENDSGCLGDNYCPPECTCTGNCTCTGFFLMYLYSKLYFSLVCPPSSCLSVSLYLSFSLQCLEFNEFLICTSIFLAFSIYIIWSMPTLSYF